MGTTERYEVRKPSAFSRNREIHRDGRCVARLEYAFLGSAAILHVDSERFRVAGRGFFKRRTVLESAGRELAAIERRGAFRSRWVFVSASGVDLAIERRGAWRPEYVLKDGGREVGRFQPPRMFRSTFEVELPADMPVPLVGLAVVVVLAATAANQANASS